MVLQKQRSWAFFVLLTCGLIFLTHRSRDSLPVSDLVFKAEAPVSSRPYSSPATQPPGILHIIVPFTAPNPDLCRTISSAVSLGYPAPVLVHTDSSNAILYNDTNPAKIISELEKCLGVLESFESGRDSDLVLLVTGPKVWFQLGPQVLLSRYFTLKHEAASQTINRDLIFATKHSSEDKTSARADVIMGSAGGMKRLLNRTRSALTSREESINLNKLVELFQWQDQHKEDLPAPEGLGLFNESRETTEAQNLGLTVDLDGGLLFARSPTNGTSEWMNHASKSGSRASRLFSRPQMLPRDIAGSRPPFFTGRPDDRFPMNATWSQQSLLTTARTGKVPAIILDDSDTGKSEWENMWFVERLAQLVQLNEYEQGEGPVAFADDRFWWPDRAPSGKYHVLSDGSPSKGLMETNLYDICAGMPEIVSRQ